MPQSNLTGVLLKRGTFGHTEEHQGFRYGGKTTQGHSKKAATHRPRTQASKETNSADTSLRGTHRPLEVLTLGLQLPELRDHNFLLLKPPGLWHMVWPPWEAKRTGSQHRFRLRALSSVETHEQKSSTWNIKAECSLWRKAVQRLAPPFSLSTRPGGPSGEPLGLQGQAVSWEQGRNQWGGVGRWFLSSEVLPLSGLLSTQLWQALP